MITNGTDQENCSGLVSGGRARRDAERKFGADWSVRRENDEAHDDGRGPKDRSMCRDGGSGGGAERTEVRAAISCAQVRTKVELCRKENESQQQGKDSRLVYSAKHLYPYSRPKILPHVHQQMKLSVQPSHGSSDFRNMPKLQECLYRADPQQLA